MGYNQCSVRISPLWWLHWQTFRVKRLHCGVSPMSGCLCCSENPALLLSCFLQTLRSPLKFWWMAVQLVLDWCWCKTWRGLCLSSLFLRLLVQTSPTELLSCEEGDFGTDLGSAVLWSLFGFWVNACHSIYWPKPSDFSVQHEEKQSKADALVVWCLQMGSWISCLSCLPCLREETTRTPLSCRIHDILSGIY